MAVYGIDRCKSFVEITPDAIGARPIIQGSYTGNGDVAQRYIEIGNSGRMLLIEQDNSEIFAVVTKNGVIVKNGLSTTALEKTEGYLFPISGTLELNSVNEALNASGKLYNYYLV